MSREKVPRFDRASVPFSAENEKYTLHVLENPPASVTVVFKQKLKTQRGGWSKKPPMIFRYKIKVPWCYFLMRQNRSGAITDTFLFFAEDKLKDTRGRVFLPPLPNIYPSGHICNGTIKVNFDDPPHIKIAEAFRAFWSTPFTEETWPEDRGLLPACFNEEEGHAYVIEYGYLKYVFSYWEVHDENHEGCSGNIWRSFRPRSKGGHYGGYLTCLQQVMDYALAFNVFDHVQT
jgi:hypothetical protein